MITLPLIKVYILVLSNILTTDIIYHDYAKNPPIADKKYRDKIISLNAQIQYIAGNGDLYLLTQGLSSGMVAVLDDGWLGRSGHLRKNDFIDLKCLCVGLIFNEPTLIRCEIK